MDSVRILSTISVWFKVMKAPSQGENSPLISFFYFISFGSAARADGRRWDFSIMYS